MSQIALYALLALVKSSTLTREFGALWDATLGWMRSRFDRPGLISLLHDSLQP